MIPANLELVIDEKLYRDQLEKRANEIADEALLLVDVKGLAKKAINE